MLHDLLGHPELKMGFLPVSILGVEMSLLRKCLQETFLPSKSHDKGNAVLSFHCAVQCWETKGKTRHSLLCSSLWFSDADWTCRKQEPDTGETVSQQHGRVQTVPQGGSTPM